MKPSIYTIKGGHLEMTVTDFGARVLSLMTPDRNGVQGDVAVGYATLEDYLECKGERFFGAVAGRLANRLGDATFELDGKEYKISVNDNRIPSSSAARMRKHLKKSSCFHSYFFQLHHFFNLLPQPFHPKS